MNQLNSVLLEGNLVRDPEVKIIGSGSSVCNFTLASNRFYKKENEKEHQKEVSYFDVEVWSKLAENCERYLQKGSGVRVVGRLKQDRWSDDQGKNRSKIRVVGEQVEFLPKRKVDDSSNSEKKNEELMTY